MAIWLDASGRERLRGSLLAAWPNSTPPDLTWLGEGFGSAAFASDSSVVVLVAKNQMGAHSRRVTTALTPELAPMVALEVPKLLWAIETAGLPYGAYGYRAVPGRKMTFGDVAQPSTGLARQLAAFLHVVHGFPIGRATELGLPDFQDFWADVCDLQGATKAALREHLTPAQYAACQGWWETFLRDQTLQQAPRCLIHGDLWPDNLLVDEHAEALLGVIDFGDAAVVDAAYDFAPLLESSPALFKGALDASSASATSPIQTSTTASNAGTSCVLRAGSAFAQPSSWTIERSSATACASFGRAQSCARWVETRDAGQARPDFRRRCRALDHRRSRNRVPADAPLLDPNVAATFRSPTRARRTRRSAWLTGAEMEA